MSRRAIVVTGCISFAALFILSILFYQERTIFTDIAFHVFYLAKEGDFAIQNNRWGAIFTQLFPLVAIRLQADLDTVLKIYSAGFVIYYFLCFLIITGILKNWRLGLIMLLMHFLIVTHTFFWIQSELPQGISFMLVFFAFYEKYSIKILSIWFWKLISFIFLCTLALFHPLLIFPFTFISLFYYLHSSQKQEKRLLIFGVALLVIAIFVKTAIFKTSSYETSALGGLKNFITLFPDYFTIDSNKTFVFNSFQYYYFLPLLLVINFIFYVRRKQFRKFFLLISFMVIYLGVVNVSYAYNAPEFYLENLYLPTCLFVLFPFIYDVLPMLSTQSSYAFVIVIVLAALLRIFMTSNIYEQRLSWERAFLEKNPDKKIVMDERLVPIDTLITSWGTPYEFWLLSTTEKSKSASIFITPELEKYMWAMDEKKVFIDTWSKYYYFEFPGQYFNFYDTSFYKVITFD